MSNHAFASFRTTNGLNPEELWELEDSFSSVSSPRYLVALSTFLRQSHWIRTTFSLHDSALDSLVKKNIAQLRKSWDKKTELHGIGAPQPSRSRLQLQPLSSQPFESLRPDEFNLSDPHDDLLT